MLSKNPFHPLKKVWRFLRKFDIEVKLPYDPATPLVAVHPEELKISVRTQKLVCSSRHYSQ